MNSKKSNRVASIAALLLSAVTIAHAATLNWTNPGTSSFGTAANWSPNQVPTSVDWARITNGGTVLIADGGTYVVSNLWVAAKNFNNATGTVRITSGSLEVSGLGSAANRPQIGVGANALGRIDVNGGTFIKSAAAFMYIGGGAGIGYLTVTNGNAFIDSLRTGSDNDNAVGGGTGYVIVAGGTFIVTNQWTIGRDRENGIVLVTGGQCINLASNYLGGFVNDDFLTIAGGNNSTGLVTVTSGGTLRAEGGIRIGQAALGEIADGTLRITGGKLVAQRLFQGAAAGTSIPRVEFDGGIIEAIYATNSLGFFYDPLSVKIKAGGIAFDSAGYDLRVSPGLLQDGTSPGGGVTKSNVGTLKLLGTNTYTGATLVQGGGLLVANASSGGGAVTANDGSGFGAAVSYAGASLNLAGLTLNAGAGTNDLNFDLGVLGNPTAPVIVVTSLTVNRTNKVNVSGAGLSVGQFTLIQYTSGSGVTADKFDVNSLPAGVSAQIVLEPNLVKLNITEAPSLHWNGNVSADWDTTTLNWLDFSTITPTPKIYSDGSAVQFDDGATTNYVNLVQALSPASLLITNQTTNYTFAGPGSIVGATSLLKKGAAMLTIATSNSYAGDTTISAGTLQLGLGDVIPQGNGKGNVIVNGTLDMNGFTDSINGLSGSGVVDNTSAVGCTLTVGNAGVAGTFNGVVMNSGGGALKLTKAGNNFLLLTGNNTHSGGTSFNSGVVQAANNNALGTGTLTFNGGGMSSDGASARSFANAVTVNAASTAGDAVNNGLITLSGLVTFNTGPFNWTVNSPVLLSGGSTGAGWSKLGTATMTLQGIHQWSSVMEVNNGTLIFDGAAMTNASGGFRVNCTVAGSLARGIITNGGAVVLLATGSNLRSGYDGNVTATNILDIAGVARIPNATGGNGGLLLGRNGTVGFANLLPGGDAEFFLVGGSDTTPAAYSEFNFNGGLLRARLANPAFMQGLSNAFVRAGGAIIDSAGVNIGIAQNLLDGGGGGGLTKLGAGNLYLNGVNTYTGGTVVSNGGLGGSGVIVGTVLVTSGGALVPGNSVGTLTVNGTLTLQGTALMEVSRDSGSAASDRAVVSTLNRGGSLVVTNSGITSLRSGDSFDLFDWTTVSGSFGSVSLAPLLPGLSWNTSNLNVNGTLSISGTAIPPHMDAPNISGGNVNVTGTGGVAGGSYYVLTSTDVALPVSSWTSIATNLFDGSGNFNFTDTFDIGTPQRFYLIAIP